MRKQISELAEGGSTALGPALLVSLALASQCTAAELIVCTDGISNVGLGSLEHRDASSLAAVRICARACVRARGRRLECVHVRAHPINHPKPRSPCFQRSQHNN